MLATRRKEFKLAPEELLLIDPVSKWSGEPTTGDTVAHRDDDDEEEDDDDDAWVVGHSSSVQNS